MLRYCARVLTPYDDFPIHNGPMPIVHPSSGDPNHFDRYFFSGQDLDGTMYIGGAMGHYPVRGVIDGAFAIAVDGIQHSVFASGMMPFDRTTAVGPLRVEVVEPLRTLRYIVEPNETGITADVTFTATTAAVEEPRQQKWTDDGVSLMDYTRLTQWGTWEGTVEVGGVRHDLDPARMRGARDRSWGTRPMAGAAASNRGPWITQYFWLWAPLHFEDTCTHLALMEDADGNPTMRSASLVPLLASDGRADVGRRSVRRARRARPGDRVGARDTADAAGPPDDAPSRRQDRGHRVREVLPLPDAGSRLRPPGLAPRLRAR